MSVATVTVLSPFALACQAGVPVAEEPPDTQAGPSDVPTECVIAEEATRTSIDGPPVWVRFCPGPDGLTAPAEVPSDALTTHLDLLDSLAQGGSTPPRATACGEEGSRTYRLQIGYADGEIAEVSGATDPGCVGSVRAGHAAVTGDVGLGVYGVVMKAFGLQYADTFDAAASDTPLACPGDPRKPDSVDVDGESADLETGYHLGRESPMVMPVAAVRGIRCTWPTWRAEGRKPTVRELSASEADRVRIGMHAIDNGMVDCQRTPNPTFSAVVEDKTGTRRAVTIIESECATVVRSDDGYGLGFPWLDRAGSAGP